MQITLPAVLLALASTVASTLVAAKGVNVNFRC